jgi:hypothetical protein
VTGEKVLTEVRLPDGTRMMVQAVAVAPQTAPVQVPVPVPAPAGGPEAVGFFEEQGGDESGPLPFDLGQVTGALGTFAEGVTAALRQARPDRLRVEFGCQVGVATGGLIAMITQGSMDANLKVTMEWERDRAPAPPAAPGGPAAASGGNGAPGA